MKIALATTLMFFALSVSYYTFNFIDEVLTRASERLYHQYVIDCITITTEGSHKLCTLLYGINKNHAKARFYNMYGSRYKIVSVTRQ